MKSNTLHISNYKILDEIISSYHLLIVRVKKAFVKVTHREDMSTRQKKNVVILRQDVDFLTNQIKDRIIR
jgi:hypothetical protein